MSPLLPHQKLMLDRAIYMYALLWDNEQQQEAMDRAEAKNGSEPPPRRKKMPNASEERETKPKRDEPTPRKTTQASREDPVAVWDGSMEGLTIFKPITMLPQTNK